MAEGAARSHGARALRAPVAAIAIFAPHSKIVHPCSRQEACKRGRHRVGSDTVRKPRGQAPREFPVWDSIHRMSSTGSNSIYGLLSTGCDPQLDVIHRMRSTGCYEWSPLIANQPRCITCQSAKIHRARFLHAVQGCKHRQRGSRWPQAQRIFGPTTIPGRAATWANSHVM